MEFFQIVDSVCVCVCFSYFDKIFCLTCFVFDPADFIIFGPMGKWGMDSPGQF